MFRLLLALLVFAWVCPALAQINSPTTQGLSGVGQGPSSSFSVGTINIGSGPQAIIRTPLVPGNEAYDSVAGTAVYHDNIRALFNTSQSVVNPGTIRSLNGGRGVVSGGSSYTQGVYYNIALTGGSGSGATANFVINSSGHVIVCDLVLGGQNYAIGDSLSVSSANVGGTGSSGFNTTVANNQGGIVGNNADTAYDNAIVFERAAWGMNAVKNAAYHSGNPMFYVGIGNCCSPANDTYDWDFAVNNEHGLGANNFPGVSWTNFRISGKTGDLTYYNHSGAPKFYIQESSGNTSVGSNTGSSSQFGVFGGATVGSGIAGTTAAPTNGLLVQGSLYGQGVTAALAGQTTGSLFGGTASGCQDTATTGACGVGAFRDDFNSNFNSVQLIQHASLDTGTTAGFANAGLQQLQFINVGSAGINLVNSNSSADFVFAPGNVAGFYIKAAGGWQTAALTFATLPPSVAGTFGYITDGKASNCGDTSCTTFGTTVTAGGGSLKILVWNNGTNWTLIGK